MSSSRKLGFRHSKFLRPLGPAEWIVSWQHSPPSAAAASPKAALLLARSHPRGSGGKRRGAGERKRWVPESLCLRNYLYLDEATICSGETMGHPLNSAT